MDIGLVGDLDHDVLASCTFEELQSILNRSPDSFLALHLDGLLPVKHAYDHHHAQFNGAGQHTVDPVGIGRDDLALWCEAAVDIGVVDLRNIASTATLEIDGQPQYPVTAPLRQGSHELPHIALGVPDARIWIGPQICLLYTSPSPRD